MVPFLVFSHPALWVSQPDSWATHGYRTLDRALYVMEAMIGLRQGEPDLPAG
jgi:hypothetical protein